MGKIEFDELSEALLGSADKINMFSHESVQVRVTEALIRAYENGLTSEKPSNQTGVNGEDGNGGAGDLGQESDVLGQRAKQPKRKAAKYSPVFDKDLNLHPEGIVSLQEFAGTLQARNQNEYCLVAIYWFSERLQMVPVTADMVYTAFRGLSLSLPADFINMIAKTGVKGWIHSGDRNDLKLSPSGINFIEREMPKRAVGAAES